jgi:hypothetical protein
MLGQKLLLDDLPVSTVHQARLQMYQATTRPKMITETFNTKWGTVKVTGKIGQVHAGLMEALITSADRIRELDSGRIQLLVDPYKVRILTYGGKQGSYERVWAMLHDLMGVVIEFDVPGRNLRALGHILDSVEESPFMVLKRNPLTGEQRPMWRVTIADAFVKIMGMDLALHYDPKPIAKLTTGIAQAVARHVATHRSAPNGGWHIDGIIQAAGGGRTVKQLQNQRADLKNDQEGLKALGLTVEDGRLKRING